MGKVFINPPSLPSTIRGDGRYVLTVLKDFVDTVSNQVNYINGFLPNETDETIAVPKYFYLSFSSNGHEFSWSSVDQVNFDHYELRLNKSVGSSTGLLASTNELKVSPPLANRSGTVYLYVVLTSGDYSSPYKLEYVKAIPSAPEHIAVSKTDEGTLIFFDAIPTNCIGAYVYVNGTRYVSYSNTFLYSGAAIVSDVLVCYFDSFGSGEFIDAYFDPPLVQGFFVERNSSFLHFYWDNVSLYNCKYVIRRNTILDWDSADFVGEVYTNSFNCIFPNNGSYYFLIKAYDEHGNTSDEASYIVLDTVPDIHRNIIIENKENPNFSGCLHNLNYNKSAEALILPAGYTSGNYTFSISLPQKYRARNWIDYNSFSYSKFDMIWADANFTWDSEKGGYSWLGSVSDAVSVVRSEIATYIGIEEDCLDGISFDNFLDTFNKVEPFSSSSVSYSPCFFGDGANVTGFDYITYKFNLPKDFSLVFCIKAVDLTSGVLFFFTNGSNWLRLTYYSSSSSFVLSSSSGEIVRVVFNCSVSDILFFGISSFGSVLKLLVSNSDGVVSSGFCNFTPVAYTSFSFGNNIEVG